MVRWLNLLFVGVTLGLGANVLTSWTVGSLTLWVGGTFVSLWVLLLILGYHCDKKGILYYDPNRGKAKQVLVDASAPLPKRGPSRVRWIRKRA